MSNSQEIADAIQRGIQSAKDAFAQEEAQRQTVLLREKKRLQPVYNAAAGLIEGLKALQNMPGSAFTFSVREHDDRLRVDTNVPQFNFNFSDRTDRLYIDVNVEESRAQGDLRYGSSDDVTSKTAEPAPILEFVAKRAALKKLIKLT